MNIKKMMQQAQKMQSEMKKTQEELKKKTFEVSVGGGAVTVKANGQKEILDVQIKPEVVDPEDVEMLQDLVMSAINESIKKADELANKELGKHTKGMNFPGIF